VIRLGQSCLSVLLFVLIVGVRLHAQNARGELCIEVHDPHGGAVASTAELVCFVRDTASSLRESPQLQSKAHQVVTNKCSLEF